MFNGRFKLNLSKTELPIAPLDLTPAVFPSRCLNSRCSGPRLAVLPRSHPHPIRQQTLLVLPSSADDTGHFPRSLSPIFHLDPCEDVPPVLSTSHLSFLPSIFNLKGRATLSKCESQRITPLAQNPSLNSLPGPPRKKPKSELHPARV